MVPIDRRSAASMPFLGIQFDLGRRHSKDHAVRVARALNLAAGTRAEFPPLSEVGRFGE
jgi:hypothetical protein